MALNRPSTECAVALLGAVIRTNIDGARVAVRLTEVEAYGGRSDPASHAYGRRTPRNDPMWGPAGTLYVYRSYGMHWCANIVVGTTGEPNAVLLRGGVVVEGRDVVVQRRGRSDHLTDGPGKLGQALGLTGEDSGSNVWAGRLRLLGPLDSVTEWRATPRIGITKAADRLWRFVANSENPS